MSPRLFCWRTYAIRASGALHLNFEGGDQRIFRVNDNVSRFALKFKADRKLHLCSPAFQHSKDSTTHLADVKQLNSVARSHALCLSTAISTTDAWRFAP